MDEYSSMSLKMAMKQLSHLGCKNVQQVRKGSSSITCEYNGKPVVADARDLLRELSADIVKQLSEIEWF